MAKFKIFNVVAGLTIATSLVSGYGIANANTSYFVAAAQQETTLKGKAGIQLIAPISKEDRKLHADVIAKLDGQNGWRLTDRGLEKFYPARTGTVEINGEKIDVNSDGTFEVKGIKEKELKGTFKRKDYTAQKSIKLKDGTQNDLELFC
ncbi:hypothetical protein [Brevibacillus fulvus]|uniref:Uncharacterized protein n=1 Tax=Brevibacillus fulvus TaxID=1125967 RepID=A0A938Y0F0_9BACL|nr:hypothetical protein [Brevibacillus fulvus]MBM7591071.1 hypothetical protein [Brevibacillus fulvus]